MSTLGNRHQCFKCEVKFYDLGKPEAVCPACGTNQAEEGEESPKSQPSAAARKKKSAAKRKTAKRKTAKPKTAKTPA